MFWIIYVLTRCAAAEPSVCIYVRAMLSNYLRGYRFLPKTLFVLHAGELIIARLNVL